MTAPCCPSGSHGPLPPDDVALRGWPERQADLECYFSGQKENPTMIILAFSDVFGPMSGRHRKICDEMATAIPGSLVCLPDLFDGEPICPDFFDSKFPGLRLKLFFPKMLYRIRYRYGWAKLGQRFKHWWIPSHLPHPHLPSLCAASVLFWRLSRCQSKLNRIIPWSCWVPSIFDRRPFAMLASF